MEGKIGKKGKMAKNWFKNFQILSNTSKIGKKGNMNVKKGAIIHSKKIETPSNMSKKGNIGKIDLCSEIRVGGNMSKIGKKGNVANFCPEKILRPPVI